MKGAEPMKHDCEHCEFIDRFIADMRKGASK